MSNMKRAKHRRMRRKGDIIIGENELDAMLEMSPEVAEQVKFALDTRAELAAGHARGDVFKVVGVRARPTGVPGQYLMKVIVRSRRA